MIFCITVFLPDVIYTGLLWIPASELTGLPCLIKIYLWTYLFTWKLWCSLISIKCCEQMILEWNSMMKLSIAAVWSTNFIMCSIDILCSGGSGVWTRKGLHFYRLWIITDFKIVAFGAFSCDILRLQWTLFICCPIQYTYCSICWASASRYDAWFLACSNFTAAFPRFCLILPSSASSKFDTSVRPLDATKTPLFICERSYNGTKTKKITSMFNTEIWLFLRVMIKYIITTVRKMHSNFWKTCWVYAVTLLKIKESGP